MYDPAQPRNCIALLIGAAILAPPAPAQSPAPIAQGVAELPAKAVPDGLGIADAVALTLSRHPEIARAFAALARGRADLGAARSVWSPQLSYQANVGPNMLSGRNATGLNDNMAGPTLYLQQQVWDFGRSKGAIGSARSTEEQRQFELEDVADKLAERAALAFLEVKRYELLSIETGKQVQSLERLRELIGLRAKAGISDRSDLMLANVRVESARGDAILAQSSLTIAEAALANLIGGTPRNYADPASQMASFSPVDAEPDYAALPGIAAAEKAAQAASAKVGQAKAEAFPRLGLQLGYTRNNYTYNRRDNAFTALVTVTGDLYKRGNHYLVQAAEHDRRAAEAARATAVVEARGRALTARQEIRGGAQRIDAYRHQEEQAAEASRIFLEEYKLGKRTLTELLNTELEIYRAASARIAAQYDILAARIRFENVSGRLRPSLGLPARLTQEGNGRNG
jgi:adhesin transport system outer membrane protein